MADAIVALSEPELLRAVEAAAVPFTPDQCDQHQRDWLAEVIHYRLHPKDKRRDRVGPQYQALERAWYQLFVHFNTMVASGEVVLWGRMEWPLARRDAEPLPAVWADELLYYPRRDTVLFRADVYRDVTAGPRTSAGTLEERQRATRNAAGSIPLAAALREWTDPALLSEVCRHERQHTSFEMAGLTTHLLLSKAQDLAQPSDQRWMLGAPDFTRFMAAWGGLENDFRARLVRGEFHLKGVMAKPRRELQPEILPGVWAADSVFDFQRGTVTIDDARYVAVTVSHGPGTHVGAVHDSIADTHDDGFSDTPVASPGATSSQKRGRKGVGPIIEEALREFWEVLFPQGAPAHPGRTTEFAARLIKRVEASRLWRGKQFPEHGTVRKHLPKIYERVLAEKDGRSQSGQ
ncbi:hypothetical protein [Neoroseomonas oryzicola]|uniref:Uncharacterized protein n=1 Tax=Neoroseomonas oryzicola TaxID=535904 RepID=A0A9X9WEE7_9PROT|nr:hypothetical protein [Neoroseomonas oryzicola]MBR0658707.1 hypothetical protein [Neoroseomonas oryzicola]NKE17857.1 hypothetical protein [Neoroseomonas oryzicola]